MPAPRMRCSTARYGRSRLRRATWRRSAMRSKPRASRSSPPSCGSCREAPWRWARTAPASSCASSTASRIWTTSRRSTPTSTSPRPCSRPSPARWLIDNPRDVLGGWEPSSARTQGGRILDERIWPTESCQSDALTAFRRGLLSSRPLLRDAPVPSRSPTTHREHTTDGRPGARESSINHLDLRGAVLGQARHEPGVEEQRRERERQAEQAQADQRPRLGRAREDDEERHEAEKAACEAGGERPPVADLERADRGDAELDEAGRHGDRREAVESQRGEDVPGANDGVRIPPPATSVPERSAAPTARMMNPATSPEKKTTASAIHKLSRFPIVRPVCEHAWAPSTGVSRRTPVRLTSAVMARLGAMIVLGIDPGMAETGYGVVDAGGRMRALDQGVIATPARAAPAERLAEIHDRVAALIDRHAPDAAALEDLFVGANPRTILSVGQARGAVLAACGRAGLEAAGYPPAQGEQIGF